MPVECGRPDYAPVNASERTCFRRSGSRRPFFETGTRGPVVCLAGNPGRMPQDVSRPREQQRDKGFPLSRRASSPCRCHLDAIPCTLASPTDNAPICSCNPPVPFVRPVAVPTTLNGTAVALALLVPVSTATP